jgi:hypothetical protein
VEITAPFAIGELDLAEVIEDALSGATVIDVQTSEHNTASEDEIAWSETQQRRAEKAEATLARLAEAARNVDEHLYDSPPSNSPAQVKALANLHNRLHEPRG